MVIERDQSLLPSTRLVFVFSTENLLFVGMNLKPAVLNNLCLIGQFLSSSAKYCIPFSEVARFGITNQTHSKITQIDT